MYAVDDQQERLRREHVAEYERRQERRRERQALAERILRRLGEAIVGLGIIAFIVWLWWTGAL